MLLPEIEMEPNEHIERKSEHEGVKSQTQESESEPISIRKASQKVKSILTVQDFAVCAVVAETRKQDTNRRAN